MDVRRILIVEDDAMIADVLGDILAALGFESVWVSAGADALERCEEQEFALVIMDLELPDINGLDAARRLWREHPGLRVLFATGYSEAADRIDFNAPAFHGIINKPFDLAEIQRAIEKALA